MPRLALLLCAIALPLVAAPVSSAATAKRCGNIVFTPQTEDGVFDIRARGTTCRTARRVARASREHGIGTEPYRYTRLRFRCVGRLDDSALPTLRWSCRRSDGARITFQRS